MSLEIAIVKILKFEVSVFIFSTFLTEFDQKSSSVAIVRFFPWSSKKQNNCTIYRSKYFLPYQLSLHITDVLYFSKILFIQRLTYFVCRAFVELSRSFLPDVKGARTRLAPVEILPLARATTLVHRVKRMHEWNSPIDLSQRDKNVGASSLSFSFSSLTRDSRARFIALHEHAISADSL